MIEWTEPYKASKERANLLKVPLRNVIFYSIATGIILSVLLWGVVTLGTNKNLAIEIYLFLGLVTALGLGWQLRSNNIVQQQVIIDNFKQQITIVGNSRNAHIVSLKDLRGYSINSVGEWSILCLYPNNGGLFSVVPPHFDTLESDLHNTLSSINQVSYIDNDTFRNNT